MSDPIVSAPRTADEASASDAVPWSAAPEVILQTMESTAEGLRAEEAERRLAAAGPNRLREIEHRSVAAILGEQFQSLVVLLLVVAMGVSFVFGQTVEGLAIAVVLAINTAIGFFTEWRAVRSMEALQELGQTTARVRRDGQERTIPADEVVPGDVVVLGSGDLIPADLRIIETDRLQVDESALTGESVPVAKDREPVSAETPVAERTNMGTREPPLQRAPGGAWSWRRGWTRSSGPSPKWWRRPGAGRCRWSKSSIDSGTAWYGSQWASQGRWPWPVCWPDGRLSS